MFDTALPNESGLRSELEAAIESLCRRLRPSRLLTCAGVGYHVDHVVTRDAAISVADRIEISIELWEDLPYALAVKTPPRLPVDLVIRTATSESWSRKYAALGHYGSQVRMLWSPGTDWAKLLTDHAIARGAGNPGELFWQARRYGGASPPT